MLQGCGPDAPDIGSVPLRGEIALNDTTLILVRHGETEWNIQSRMQGHRDIALSPRGVAQAEAVARHLTRVPTDETSAIAAVFASDLMRARATAAPIAARAGVPLRIDPRLRERGFGLFEGSTYAEAHAKWPEIYATWQRREPDYAVPGGESYEQVRARTLAVVEDIAREFAGKTVVVVTHGGILDAVYRAAFDIPWKTPRPYAIPNGSIGRVTARLPGPALRIHFWADRDHLDTPPDLPR